MLVGLDLAHHADDLPLVLPQLRGVDAGGALYCGGERWWSWGACEKGVRGRMGMPIGRSFIPRGRVPAPPPRSVWGHACVLGLSPLTDTRAAGARRTIMSWAMA